MTPYMCTRCGKAFSSSMEAKNCDHKKPVAKKAPQKKAPQKTPIKEA